MYFDLMGKHTVKAGEVDAWLGHQSGQPGNEIQRLKDDVRGAVAVRCLELVPDIAIRRQ